jgi:hypothetical protein
VDAVRASGQEPLGGAGVLGLLVEQVAAHVLVREPGPAEPPRAFGVHGDDPLGDDAGVVDALHVADAVPETTEVRGRDVRNAVRRPLHQRPVAAATEPGRAGGRARGGAEEGQQERRDGGRHRDPEPPSRASHATSLPFRAVAGVRGG